MACRESRRLQAYLEADLPLPERARLDGHLARCSTCRQTLAELQQLENLLAELAPAAPPPGFAGETLLRARRELQWSRRPAVTWAAAMTVASAAAALLLCVLQWGLLQPPRPVPAPLAVIADAVPVHPQMIHRLAFSAPAATRAPRLTRFNSLPRRTMLVSAAGHRRAPRLPRGAPATALTGLPVEKAAACAYLDAARQASGDPDLTVAALENVATAYPRSQQAAKALLAAANLQRQRGNLVEADVAYRRVLALKSQPVLAQALAHQALGDLRRQSVGDDEVALYHYTQAARVLQRPGSTHDRQTLVVLADVEKATGQRQRATANYATVINSGARSSAVQHSAEALADVL